MTNFGNLGYFGNFQNINFCNSRYFWFYNMSILLISANSEHQFWSWWKIWLIWAPLLGLMFYGFTKIIYYQIIFQPNLAQFRLISPSSKPKLSQLCLKAIFSDEVSEKIHGLWSVRRCHFSCSSYLLNTGKYRFNGWELKLDVASFMAEEVREQTTKVWKHHILLANNCSLKSNNL